MEVSQNHGGGPYYRGREEILGSPCSGMSASATMFGHQDPNARMDCSGTFTRLPHHRPSVKAWPIRLFPMPRYEVCGEKLGSERVSSQYVRRHHSSGEKPAAPQKASVMFNSFTPSWRLLVVNRD